MNPRLSYMDPYVGMQVDYWPNHLFSLKNRLFNKMTILGQVSSPVLLHSAMATCGARSHGRKCGCPGGESCGELFPSEGAGATPSPGLSSTLHCYLCCPFVGCWSRVCTLSKQCRGWGNAELTCSSLEVVRYRTGPEKSRASAHCSLLCGRIEPYSQQI